MARIAVPLNDRLWSRVDKSGDCWVWQGQRNSDGYGLIGLGAGRRGENAAVHRLTYELLIGPIPEGMQLDHRCHNRACCNPDHLQVATSAANMQNLSGAYANSRTGVRGVTFDARRGVYRVRAAVGGRRIQGGHFATLPEAEAAAIALRNRVMTNNLLDRTAS